MYKNKVEIKIIVLRTRLNRRTRVIWTKSDANKCYLKEEKKKIKWQEKWKKIKEKSYPFFESLRKKFNPTIFKITTVSEMKWMSFCCFFIQIKCNSENDHEKYNHTWHKYKD